MTRRPLVAALLAALAVTSAFIFVLSRPAPDRSDLSGVAPGIGTPNPPERTAIPIPIPGHEVYGYVPYWEMDAGIADHLAGTDLTTLALFSVTHKKDGALAAGERGYKRIDGPIGRELIAGAHERGVRVELVYTSFGRGKNAAFFSAPEAQDRTIAELVALAADLGVDGINVDVELLAAGARPGIRRVRRPPAVRDPGRRRRRPGLGGNAGQHQWNVDGGRRRGERRRSDLHDGL